MHHIKQEFYLEHGLHKRAKFTYTNPFYELRPPAEIQDLNMNANNKKRSVIFCCVSLRFSKNISPFLSFICVFVFHILRARDLRHEVEIFYSCTVQNGETFSDKMV